MHATIYQVHYSIACSIQRREFNKIKLFIYIYIDSAWAITRGLRMSDTSPRRLQKKPVLHLF